MALTGRENLLPSLGFKASLIFSLAAQFDCIWVGCNLQISKFLAKSDNVIGPLDCSETENFSFFLNSSKKRLANYYKEVGETTHDENDFFGKI